MASPRRKHIAVMALHWAGYSDEEIGKALGYAPATVRGIIWYHPDAKQADEDMRRFIIELTAKTRALRLMQNETQAQEHADRLRELVAADGPIADRFADRPCPDCPLTRDRTGAGHVDADGQTQTQAGGDTPPPGHDPS